MTTWKQVCEFQLGVARLHALISGRIQSNDPVKRPTDKSTVSDCPV